MENIMTDKAVRIRTLNDELRQHLIGGLAVITPGVAALGPGALLSASDTDAVDSPTRLATSSSLGRRPTLGRS